MERLTSNIGAVYQSQTVFENKKYENKRGGGGNKILKKRQEGLALSRKRGRIWNDKCFECIGITEASCTGGLFT